MKISEKLYSYSEFIGQKFVQIMDDVYTPYVILVGYLTRQLMTIFSEVFADSNDKKPKNFILGKLLRLGKIVFGIPLLVFLFIISLFIVLIGGAIASIIGLRNLGDYTFSEQLLALLPIVAMLCLIPSFASDVVLYRFSNAFVLAIIVMGLNFIWGQCGIFTIGHASFVTLGAYFTAWLNMGSLGPKFPFAIALLMAGLINTVFGFILGLPSLRIKDHYLVVVTIAFSLVVVRLLKTDMLSGLSGFKRGGLSFEVPPPPEFLNFVSSSTWNYFVIIFFFMIFTFIAHQIRHRSQLGRAFRAIRCDSEVASILGVSIVRYKLVAFGLSAFYAAIGGGLGLLLLPLIAPETYGGGNSVEYMVGLVVGGPGNVFGSVLGGIYLAFEQSFGRKLADMTPRGQNIITTINGLILIFTVYFIPGGLAQKFGKLFKTGAGRVRRWNYYLNPPPDYDIVERRKSLEVAGKKND